VHRGGERGRVDPPSESPVGAYPRGGGPPHQDATRAEIAREDGVRHQDVTETAAGTDAEVARATATETVEIDAEAARAKALETAGEARHQSVIAAGTETVAETVAETEGVEVRLQEGPVGVPDRPGGMTGGMIAREDEAVAGTEGHVLQRKKKRSRTPEKRADSPATKSPDRRPRTTMEDLKKMYGVPSTNTDDGKTTSSYEAETIRIGQR